MLLPKRSDMKGMSDEQEVEISPAPGSGALQFAAAARLAASARLRQRRFELLPLYGPGAVLTEVQGRTPGESTSAEGLAELISSIGTVGVLQPILVEELPDGTHRLVAGERRLRSCRIGAVDQPENPHFQTIPAVLCPGPLAADERATWQLIENLARSDLKPGDLAQALIYERCGMLAVRLEEEGTPAPSDILTIDSAIDRWTALNKWRIEAGKTRIGAPWGEVVKRLGLHLSDDRVEQIVRAFAQMPPEIAEDMDREGVTLNARLSYLKLAKSKEDAAAELWAAVKATGKSRMLSAAAKEMEEHPDLSADEALSLSETRHDDANIARSEAAKARHEASRPDDEAADGDEADNDAMSSAPEFESEPIEVEPTTVNPEVAKRALDSISGLLAELRAGCILSKYQAGSMTLYVEELRALLVNDTDH